MTTSFDDTAATYSDVVQESISFIGAEHDFFVRRKVDLLVSIAARHLGNPSGLTLLDVGSGVGMSDVGVAGHVGALIGCDPSVESVREAAGRNPSVGYAAADGTCLPFPDGAVDLTFAINVLHHVDPTQRAAFVGEMARVVRPGGLVVAFEHNPLNPLTRRSVDKCEFDEGVELLGRRELADRLSTDGLTEVERRYVIFTPFDVAWQHRIESLIGRVPLGAQHYVVARKTR